MTLTAQFELYFDDDSFFEGELPAKWVECSRCRGKGTHVNPAVDGNGISQYDECWQDPDFRDDYMGGVYDVTCYECNGKGVKAEPDFARWPAGYEKAYYQHLADLDEMAAEQAAERRCGA